MLSDLRAAVAALAAARGFSVAGCDDLAPALVLAASIERLLMLLRKISSAVSL